MESYKELIRHILNTGKIKHNRTGIDTLSVSGYMFQHNMSEGFPLLTTKKMAYKNIFSELEFFIKGYHNKKWLQERNNHIWDEWCTPLAIQYSNDNNTKANMKKIDELGPIYGVQWRNFDASFLYDGFLNELFPDPNSSKRIDQLATIVNTIKTDPESRRMICSAWNPNQMYAMALPPCHVLWQVLINTDDNTMDLIWYQRSVDTMLGLPFNIASYAALLELLCLESKKYVPGNLIGMLGDVHIYTNHIEGAKTQLERNTHKLPKFKVNGFTNIFSFESKNVEILDYEHEDKINFEIAV